MSDKTRIKVISLWQPWASLVMLGEKRFETRSWWPNYTGPLGIHAAKKWNRELFQLCQTEPFKTVLARYLVDGAFVLPLGVALGTVELVDVFSTELVRRKIGARELAFGDYSDGRAAWKLRNPRLFPEPVPIRGHQGLWYMDVPTEWLT